MDLDKLAQELEKKLPKYARPLFVRLISSLELTGTYKLKKTQLQQESYDVSQITDPVFFMGPKDKTYKRLGRDLYHQIQTQVMQQEAKL